MYDVLTTIAALSGFFMFVRCVVVSDASEGLQQQIMLDVAQLILVEGVSIRLPVQDDSSEDIMVVIDAS